MKHEEQSDALATLGVAGDIATVVLALVAIVITVWTSVSQHRSNGPLVKVSVLYHARLKSRDGSTGGIPYATTPLGAATEIEQRFGSTYIITPFLRAVLVNRGRMSIQIENVAFENRQGRSVAHQRAAAPSYPVVLEAQTSLAHDELYTEMVEFSGRHNQIRFVANLSNGEQARSSWIKVYMPSSPLR